MGITISRYLGCWVTGLLGVALVAVTGCSEDGKTIIEYKPIDYNNAPYVAKISGAWEDIHPITGCRTTMNLYVGLPEQESIGNITSADFSANFTYYQDNGDSEVVYFIWPLTNKRGSCYYEEDGNNNSIQGKFRYQTVPTYDEETGQIIELIIYRSGKPENQLNFYRLSPDERIVVDE